MSIEEAARQAASKISGAAADHLTDVAYSFVKDMSSSGLFFHLDDHKLSEKIAEVLLEAGVIS
jgi:hypothetical protein